MAVSLVFFYNSSTVHLTNLHRVAEANLEELKRRGFDVEYLLSLGPDISTVDLLASLGSGRASPTQWCLLSQVTLALAMMAERRMLEEVRSLDAGVAPKEHEVHFIPDSESCPATGAMAARILSGIKAVTHQPKTRGTALDASRIGTRKRMVMIGTVPRRCAFFLPTKVRVQMALESPS